MGGQVSGFQARIQQLYPRAVYTHCRSSALSSGMSMFSYSCRRNTMNITEKIAVFFSATGA